MRVHTCELTAVASCQFPHLQLGAQAVVGDDTPVETTTNQNVADGPVMEFIIISIKTSFRTTSNYFSFLGLSLCRKMLKIKCLILNTHIR